MKLAEFQKLAEMLAREHKTVIKEGRSWSANIQNRTIFYNKADIYNLPEEQVIGFLLHETAHIHYTKAAAMPKENPELVGTALNVLEDIAIEEIISSDYPNARDILDSTREDVLDTLVRILPDLKQSVHQKSLLYAAARFEGRGYLTAIHDYEEAGNHIAEMMDKEEKAIYKRKHTRDLLPLATRISDYLIQRFKAPDEPAKQMMRQELDGASGNAKTSSEDTDLKKNITKAMKSAQGWSPKGASFGNENIAFVDEIADRATMIGKQLRTVLKRNNAMEFGGRYRTGKLMAKRFVRVVASRDKRPFARRIIKSNQSYAFAVTSDVSGSMFNDTPEKSKVSYAASSMYMVSEALRTAGIPRSLMVFGTYGSIIAPMNRVKIPWEDIINNNTLSKAGGGTNIDNAMETCMTELAKVRAERKIMIILTDGDVYGGSIQKVYKKAKQQGIECLAIIVDPYDGYVLEEIFDKDKTIRIHDVNNAKEVGEAFIKILKDSVKAAG